jgi:hypothetical protein
MQRQRRLINHENDNDDDVDAEKFGECGKKCWMMGCCN